MVLLTRESRPPPVFILFLKVSYSNVWDFFFALYFLSPREAKRKYQQSAKSNQMILVFPCCCYSYSYHRFLIRFFVLCSLFFILYSITDILLVSLHHPNISHLHLLSSPDSNGYPATRVGEWQGLRVAGSVWGVWVDSRIKLLNVFKYWCILLVSRYILFVYLIGDILLFGLIYYQLYLNHFFFLFFNE